MTFCSKCGNELPSPDADVCTHCGKLVKEHIRGNELSPKIWYVISILFGIIGGLIAYVILKNDSPKLAKNCLIIGVILSVVTFALVVIINLALMMSMNSMIYDSMDYDSINYDSMSGWETETQVDPFADIADKVKQDNRIKQLEEIAQVEEDKEQKRKLEQERIQANDKNLKIQARENIEAWKQEAQQFEVRFAALGGSASELSETNYHSMYAGFLFQIRSYESAINNLKNTSSDQVDQVMEIHEKAVSSYYDKVNLFLQHMENVAKYND